MKKKKQPSGVKKPTARQLVKRLEEQIAAARLQMESRQPGSGGAGIANHILNLERQLAVARSHIKSKFSSVNHSVVDGSFGSGKRR
ncbi:hypothetical protein E5198_00750 [Pseudomonas sp. A-1]|uniref:hypothetical protein n=1 Tax=Pseudomonas sp. A-1 TaxID=1821274 RepID=UPI0010A6075E|nr:hypothetical protein [Pseudomonas sp. A-1]THG87078.1 hypothetical protein E5198_00750 [Pseudomonas sp. A-1]